MRQPLEAESEGILQTLFKLISILKAFMRLQREQDRPSPSRAALLVPSARQSTFPHDDSPDTSVLLPFEASTVIIKHKQPHDGLGHLQPIVLQMRRLGRPVRMLQVLDAAAVDPHLNLPPDHVLVESQVGLRREQPVDHVQPLHGRVRAAAPAHDLGSLCLALAPRQQLTGGVRRGRLRDLVLVHLVQEDVVGAGAEQALARRVDVDARVAQLPVAGGRGRDRAPEQAGEQLVAEAHAGEFEFRSRQPEIWFSHTYVLVAISAQVHVKTFLKKK